MTDNKCKGCQSFCMLGHQLASADAVEGNKTSTEKVSHTKKGTYPTSWKTKWNNVKGWADKVGKENETTIQSSGGLSQQTQNDLIQFIKDTYNEGNINCSKIKESIDKWKSEHSSGTSNPLTIYYSSNPKQYSQTHLDDVKVGSDHPLIKARHYNVPQLILKDDGELVTKDAKGDIVNGNKSGPSVGSAIVKESIMDITPKKKDDLIEASLYKNLSKRASKLMYHPYQCNYCNIYEGGQWCEIVDELAKALGDTLYDQGKYTSATAAGIEANFRQDCSGFVNGCVDIFNATLTGVYEQTDGTSDRYVSLEGLPPAVQEYFEPYTISGYNKKGSITVRHPKGDGGIPQYDQPTEHVEVCGLWSGGGCGSDETVNIMMHRIYSTSGDAGLRYKYDE